MKKNIVVLLLVITFMISGCEEEMIEAPESFPIPEAMMEEKENTVSEAKEVSEEPVDLKEVITTEETAEVSKMVELDKYITTVMQEAAVLQTFLETEELTQTEMNEKSQEMYELWDKALNFLWAELKVSLGTEEFKKLKEEQILWIDAKEKAMKEAGKEFEGGSIYPFVVNNKAASLTEERVHQLYEILKQIQ